MLLCALASIVKLQKQMKLAALWECQLFRMRMEQLTHNMHVGIHCSAWL